jgi:hypothetical protein
MKTDRAGSARFGNGSRRLASSQRTTSSEDVGGGGIGYGTL